jgi:hypothetical protein
MKREEFSWALSSWYACCTRIARMKILTLRSVLELSLNVSWRRHIFLKFV